MTEEDTFRMLKRPTFQEMKKLEREWVENREDTRQFLEVLLSNGWRYDEYETQEDKRGLFISQPRR